MAVSFAQIVAILLHYFVPFVHVVCSKVCHPDAVFLHMDYVIFRRKILPPAGATSRYRPPPSNSLAFFPASVGLAFLIWRSFRGIFGVGFRGYFQMPPNIPPVFALLNCTAIGGIGQSGRGNQDGNRPVSPVVIGFGLRH